MDFNACRPYYVAEPIHALCYQSEYCGNTSSAVQVTDVIDDTGKACHCLIENSDFSPPEEVTFDVEQMSESFDENDSCEESLLTDDLSVKDQAQTVHSLGVCEIFDEISPETNFLDEETEVNLDNIQLYLECSDDNVVINDSLKPNLKTSSAVAEATSQIKMDTRFKISFPLVPEKALNCALCQRVFVSKGFLRKHSMTFHSDIFKFCSYCPYFTKSLKFFQTHVKSRHPQAPSLSDDIGNQFDPSEGIKITFTLDGPLNDTCRQGESTGIVTGLKSQQLKNALSSDTIDNLLNSNCVIKTFKNSDKKVKDSVELNVKCNVCDFITKSNRLLNYHKKTMHNDQREMLKCNLCNYVCRQKKSFDAHVKKHEGLLEFHCDVCRKKFASKHLLTKHQRIHKRHGDVRGINENKIDSMTVTSSRSTQTRITCINRKRVK